MLKQAYEDDAVPRLNRQKGWYYFSGRYSIKEREDGQYDPAELRAACEQLLAAQRESGSRLRLMGKQYLGVRFIYPAGQDGAPVRVEGAAPPLVAAHPFDASTMGVYQVVFYRFADWPAQGKVVTAPRPLAVGALFD